MTALPPSAPLFSPPRAPPFTFSRVAICLAFTHRLFLGDFMNTRSLFFPSISMSVVVLIAVWGLTTTLVHAQNADGFVRDAVGRISYIVELDPAAADSYTSKPSVTGRFPSYNRGNVVNFVLALEGQHGVKADKITSWSSVSFTAYLTDAQHSRLLNDPRVSKIIPDRFAVFSGDTTAVWADTTLPSGEVQGWGKHAISQASTPSNGTAVVYVVDGGVGRHDDLNVVEWAIPAGIPDGTLNTCGSRVGTTCTLTQFTWMVSCFTHATAVAGIIGAKSNGVGMQGIDPGVQIVSVNVFSAADRLADKTHTCYPPPTIFPGSDVKGALDWVYSDIQTYNNSGRSSVVNLSINDSVDSYFTDIWTLASHNGLVAQSAGNNLDRACNHAFSDNGLCVQQDADGVMVVGAINNHGQPVVPLNGLPGFWEDYAAFLHEIGTNWDPNINWAPGENIYTTIGGTKLFGNSYIQRGDTSYNTYGTGSGTSFAAPHLAGLAAYLIETTTPLLATAINTELAVASHKVALNSFQPSGIVGGIVQQGANSISMPTLNPPSSPHSTPYAELAMATTCFAPAFATGAGGCSVQLPLANYAEPSLGTQFARNNGILTRAASAPIWVSIDSYGGTGACKLYAAEIPWIGGFQVAPGDRYYGAMLTSFATNPSGGYWSFYSPVCTSAALQLNY